MCVRHHLIYLSQWSCEMHIIFPPFKNGGSRPKTKKHAQVILAGCGRTRFKAIHVNANSVAFLLHPSSVITQIPFWNNTIMEIIKSMWLLHFSKHPDVFKDSSKLQSVVLQYCKHLFSINQHIANFGYPASVIRIQLNIIKSKCLWLFLFALA